MIADCNIIDNNSENKQRNRKTGSMKYVPTVIAALAAFGLAAPTTAEMFPGCAAALAYSDANKGVAVLVLHEGTTVCASNEISKPQELWSGTKSLVGLMAAAAAQDKLLTFDERASDTITEWQGDPQKSAITLRQLLGMTSGQPSAIGRPQGYADSLKAPLTAAPGTRFQYGPTPLQIFGEVMRRKLAAAGHDPDPHAYLERRLLAPLGVKVGEWRKGADGNPLMPQGLVLAASEWAKIGEFVRAGGKLDDKSLVDPEGFAELFEGSSVNPAYGLTWWLPRATPSKDSVTTATDITDPAANLPHDMVVAAGAGDQRLYVIPSLGLTIVRQARLDISAILAGERSQWSDAHFLKLLLAPS